MGQIMDLPVRRTDVLGQTIAAAAPSNGEAAALVAPPGADGGEFLDRELSWLEFNRRVLHEALDERTPLLERVRFLGIFSSNLDEFFMKRVWGLKLAAAPGVVSRVADQMLPAQTLSLIRQSI